MKYFIVNQEEKAEYTISLKDFDTKQKVLFTQGDADKFNGITNLSVIGKADAIYPDLYLAPLPMVSEKLKDIFQMYETNLIYKTVVFTNLEQKTQKVYRLMLTPIIEGLSEKTEYYKNNWEKHLVLKEKSLNGQQVFHLKTSLTNYLVVSLDVAESILKRGCQGLWFEEIEVDRS